MIKFKKIFCSLLKKGQIGLIAVILSTLSIPVSSLADVALANFSPQYPNFDKPLISLNSQATERMSKRTKNSQSFETASNQGFAEVSSSSINFKNQAGQFVPINNQLIPDSSQNYFTNAANRYQAKFAKSATNNLLTLSQNQ